MDDFVERHVSIVFLVIGLLMVVAAAVVDMVDGLAITFAILGVGLIALGGLARLLEGAFEIGPRGFKGQIAARGARAIELAEEVNPAIAEPIREAVRFVTIGEKLRAPSSKGLASDDPEAETLGTALAEEMFRKSLQAALYTGGAAVPQASGGLAPPTRGAATPD